MNEHEAVCRRAYTETRRLYADVKAQLGPAALGFRVLYGPPTVGAPYMFIGYQPGGREIENVQHHETWPETCDYATKDWPLAKKIRFIWGGDIVARCTGLNAVFFRAPSIEDWYRIPKPLRHYLEEFSFRHAKAIVCALQPKQIILIGLRTFDALLTGEPFLLGSRDRILAKKGSLWGHPTIGTVHLTGARISGVDQERIRTLFSPQISN